MDRINQGIGKKLFYTGKYDGRNIPEEAPTNDSVICLGCELGLLACQKPQYEDIIKSIHLLLTHTSLKYSHASTHQITQTPEYIIAHRLFEFLQADNIHVNQVELENVLKTAKLEMSNDRTVLDIIAHIILSFTGIGLVVLVVNKIVNESFFLTSTNQQQIIEEISVQVRHGIHCR